jgi:hypothetical protein
LKDAQSIARGYGPECAEKSGSTCHEVAMAPKREPVKKTAEDEIHKMALPDGKTCIDCRYYKRCGRLVGQLEKDEVCIWSPSRYLGKDDHGEG